MKKGRCCACLALAFCSGWFFLRAPLFRFLFLWVLPGRVLRSSMRALKGRPLPLLRLLHGAARRNASGEEFLWQNGEGPQVGRWPPSGAPPRPLEKLQQMTSPQAAHAHRGSASSVLSHILSRQRASCLSLAAASALLTLPLLKRCGLIFTQVKASVRERNGQEGTHPQIQIASLDPLEPFSSRVTRRLLFTFLLQAKRSLRPRHRRRGAVFIWSGSGSGSSRAI